MVNRLMIAIEAHRSGYKRVSDDRMLEVLHDLYGSMVDFVGQRYGQRIEQNGYYDLSRYLDWSDASGSTLSGLVHVNEKALFFNRTAYYLKRRSGTLLDEQLDEVILQFGFGMGGVFMPKDIAEKMGSEGDGFDHQRHFMDRFATEFSRWVKNKDLSDCTSYKEGSLYVP